MSSEHEKTCCSPKRSSADNVGIQNTGVLSSRKNRLLENLVEIPGGKAFIGTDSPELVVDCEAPFRQKNVKPFLIQKTTVTNVEFQQFVNETGYVTEAEKFGDSFVFRGLIEEEIDINRTVADVPWWVAKEGACWHSPVGKAENTELDPTHPAIHISWNDANAFATWAGGRLPTEAEWEHAARGGLGDVRFPWGDKEPNEHDYFPCNIWQGEFPDRNDKKDGYFATAPAQSYDPNGYGLFNMVGNVWEWTSQTFKVTSLKKSIAAAHQGKKGYKILKGGSFLCHASYCYRYRIAARTSNSPDSSTSHQGFRLVFDQA